MPLIEIEENEINKIKTLCEFLFFDQYNDTASFLRFEKCFQPLFNNIENISFINIFKDIVGKKRKYITFKRFLKAYLNYKNSKDILHNDTKIFFDKLFNSILKTPNEYIGKDIENNLSYSNVRSCKFRDSITKLQVLNDAKGIIHGINLEYDEIYKIGMFPKKLEDKLQLILDMKLDIIDNNLFKKNLKRYKQINSNLYRDAITHIFGTINARGFISFLGFKTIIGKTLYVGFPEGEGFLFGEYGKNIHDFRIQLNDNGINKLQSGFRQNHRTNYYLAEIKNISYEEIIQDELIKDEENLNKIQDEKEIDKLITTPLIEDNHFFDPEKKDEYCGNDYKEVIDQYPRKWLNDTKLNKYKLIKTVNNALNEYDSELDKTTNKTTIILENPNKVNDYKYHPYQNPFILKPKEYKKVSNPFFSKTLPKEIINEQINEEKEKFLHKTRIFKNPFSIGDRDDEFINNENNKFKTQIVMNRTRLNINNFFNKKNFNNLVGALAKEINKDLAKNYIDDNNSIQNIFLNKLFPYKRNLSEEEIISYDENKIKIEDSKEIEEKDSQQKIEINEEEGQDEFTICSNALIFDNKIKKIQGLKGGFFANVFNKFFSRNKDDSNSINKWKKLRKGLEKINGVNLFQTMGAVIKAMKLVNKKDVSVSEKIKLYQILKENQNIFNFLTIKKIEPEEEQQVDILIPDEHPELVTNLNVIQKNLETLKEYKKMDLPKEKKEKIDSLFNLYLKQKNILIENETKKHKEQIIRKNCIDYDKYLKEEEEKRKKLIEKENKKIEEIELKNELEEKQRAKTLLKKSFYSNEEIFTKKIFLNQKLPEKQNIWKDDIFKPEKNTLCPYDKRGNWIIPKDGIDDDVYNWEQIDWCKAEQINDMVNYQVILNEPNYDNVFQGMLNDCYFLSAISSLCSHKSYYDKIFHIKCRTIENAYGVYLFINGQKKLVIVDDYFPYINNNSRKQLCFGFSGSNELWVSLIEKAWAKINGSYIRIGTGGFSNEAFDVLTEAYTEHISIPRDFDKIKDELWRKLDQAIKRNYVVCLGTYGDDNLEEKGLVSGHAYTLINIYIVKTKSGIEKVVKLRNPYGDEEYNGRWGDNDSVWNENKEFKKKFNYLNKVDGIFHMPYEVMLRCFAVIDIAKLEDNYKTKIVKIPKTKNTQCQVIKLEIEQNKTHCYINLYQKNPRIINKNKNYPENPVLSFIMLAKIEGNELKYITSKTSIKGKDVNNEFTYEIHFAIEKELTPGTYYIFSDVNYRYNYTDNFGYTITTYSEYPVKSLINVTEFVNINKLFKNVIYDYCKNSEKVSKTTYEGSVIYRKNLDLYYPFITCCIENKSDSDIKYEFKLINEGEYMSGCFYCENNVEEGDDSIIKIIKPNSFEICVANHFDLGSKFKIKIIKIKK